MLRNKGAHKVCGYHTTDLGLSFLVCKYSKCSHDVIHLTEILENKEHQRLKLKLLNRAA